MTNMPGKSYQGYEVPSHQEHQLIKYTLIQHVETLAAAIGPRNYIAIEALNEAKDYIAHHLEQLGYQVEKQTYPIQEEQFSNLYVTKVGKDYPDEWIVIGAHYDTVHQSPGANDNGSGVAAILTLAELIRNKVLKRTVQFVLFTNEEPPFFQTRQMGSFVYAKKLHQEKRNVKLMMSVEMIGYYSDMPNSQHYLFPLGWYYPDKANFIGFVGNLRSRAQVKQALNYFRDSALIPSEGAALLSWLPGVGWSDQWSFWKMGYPAIMVTDTAFFRYPYYHTDQDTPDKLDFDRMTTVVKELEEVVVRFANEN